VVEIARELGIHAITLYKWRKAWRLQGAVVPASEKEVESWSAADKFTVVLETAGLNTTELGGYCRERGLYPEQVDRWRKAAQDANAPGGPAGNQTAAAALLIASKKIQAYWGEGGED
jgi:transposase-like protein